MSANEYIVGQVIMLKDAITNPALADVLTDDATDVVTVYLPDGTSTTPSPTRASLGTYTAQYTPSQTGWHEYVWRSTTTGAGAGRGRFYVAPVP